MFVSLTPGDATLWSGVLFVRKGKRYYSTTDIAILISHDRTLLPCYTQISNIFPRLVSSASAPGRLHDRHVPSSYHTLNNIHVHNRHPRKRHRERI